MSSLGSDPGPAPGAALALFGDRISAAERYVAHLATTGVDWGLIGPREVPRLWERHVLNCAVLAELLPDEATVIDVGSGAGLPGIPLALARPDARITLVEPLERRCAWLHRVIDDLGLPITVARARAEEVAGHLTADVVTARAVAALPKLARWLVPLLGPGGVVLAMKGRSAAEEIESASSALRKLKVRAALVRCGEGVVEEPTSVVRLERLR